MNFKNFLEEQLSYDEFVDRLHKLGHKDIEKISNKRVKIITNGNRVELLKDLAKAWKGSEYDPNGGGSTTGIVHFPDKFGAVAKPKTGGGSGGGAALTKMAESAQCIYLAARWYEGGKYQAEDLIRASTMTLGTDDVNKIINNLPESWITSSIAVASILHRTFGRKQFKFHHDSEWVARLKRKFKKLNKMGGSNEFSNINKWSPADIYMITAEGEKETFEDCDSILEMNARLQELLRSMDVIGISLKKVSKPKMTFVNTNDRRDTYEVKNPFYTSGKRGFFASKDVYIYYHEGTIQFRGFNTVNFQGEIKGKMSAHGKVGNGTIKTVIKHVTGGQMRMANEVSKIFDDEKSKMRYIKEFYKYYKVVEDRPLSEEEFTKKVLKKDRGWFISKSLGTQLVYFMKRSGKMDAVVGKILLYAASQSEKSAPYIKIS